MKLEKISIQNFRGYKDKITLDLSNFTALVGKNDIGKSTIMDALDIFFNNGKGTIKIDKTEVPNDKNEKAVITKFDFVFILSLKSDMLPYNSKNRDKFFRSSNFWL